MQFDRLKRRELIAVVGGAVAWPIAARAQQADRMRRIAVLMAYAESDSEARAWVTAFRERLKTFGWTESRNIAIDLHWATGETEPGPPSREGGSSRHGPSSCWPSTTPATTALLQQTRTIPIVFALVDVTCAHDIEDISAALNARLCCLDNRPRTPTIGHRLSVHPHKPLDWGSVFGILREPHKHKPLRFRVMADKIRTGNKFFVMLIIITLLMLAAVLVPAFIPNVAFLESAEFRWFLLIIVCFTIAMFIFGILGDSSAKISSPGGGGILWQLTGSAAGFIIFYLILSWGLSPVWSLNVFLDDQNGNRFASSALVEVRGNPRQEMETSSGNLTFAYLPKGLPAELAVVSDRYALDMEKIAEDKCLKKVRTIVEVSSDCSHVTLILKPRPVTGVIKDFTTGGYANLSLTLGDAVSELLGKLRYWGASRGIVADAVFGQKANSYKDYVWSLNYDYPRNAGLCLLLADYRDQFNRRYPSVDIRFSVGAKTVYVLSADDTGGEDDQCK